MKPKTRIQVLRTCNEDAEKIMAVIIDRLDFIQQEATKLGIRSLLISPLYGWGEYPVTFRFRMHDNSFGKNAAYRLARKVEEDFEYDIQVAVYSPDAPFIQDLDLIEPFEDQLDEKPVTREELIQWSVDHEGRPEGLL